MMANGCNFSSFGDEACENHGDISDWFTFDSGVINMSFELHQIERPDCDPKENRPVLMISFFYRNGKISKPIPYEKVSSEIFSDKGILEFNRMIVLSTDH